ncbi:MAG: phosphotransferase [Lachnospiraceae bacterium]|nr:phosphotransferase [Lachnospiraceae bacterium]
MLHGFRDYAYFSSINQDKTRFYNWFAERPFKPEFDRILDELPDFSRYEQCFIHSDLGPHNAMRRNTGEVVLIDLDDAGIGSKYLDLGWAFIMQFVDFNHQTEEMRYRFDLALAFLQGYYGDEVLSQAEYDLIWQGAVYMHISYMQVYGPDAVDSLWKILQYGMDQKRKLWEKWCIGQIV